MIAKIRNFIVLPKSKLTLQEYMGDNKLEVCVWGRGMSVFVKATLRGYAYDILAVVRKYVNTLYTY